MGVHERNVKVYGELNEVYRSLVKVLLSKRYEITAQDPPRLIAANRGSKVITLAMGTADYEELNVTLFPAEQGSVEVQFHFTFPWKSLLFLTPSERRKHEEGDRMIDTFVRLVETTRAGAGSVTGSGTVSGEGTDRSNRVCPSCGAVNGPHVSFCTSCGSPIPQGRSPEGAGGVCPACSGHLEGTEKFCPSCGHRLRTT